MVGLWGTPTATLDWCELNYDATFYVAEFCMYQLCSYDIDQIIKAIANISCKTAGFSQISNEFRLIKINKAGASFLTFTNAESKSN